MRSNSTVRWMASSPWRGVLLGELAGLWRGIAWQRVYDWRLLRRWAAGAGALLLLGLALFLLKPDGIPPACGPGVDAGAGNRADHPTRVVEVSPGDRVVARGTVLAMRVTLAGEAPAEVWLVVTMGDGRVERHAAKRVGETMAWTVDCKWSGERPLWV